MATTLHLGDCLNGCDICKDRYHEALQSRPDWYTVCTDCGVEL